MPVPTPVSQATRGFFMGMADIVPGVSGGTVALVFGIYDRLIHNIREGARALKRLLTGDLQGFRSTLRTIDWVWLISLLVGVLAAIAALSSVIERLLDDRPIEMAGLFLGLVLGTVVVAWRLIDRVDAIGLTIMAGVGIGLFLLLGLRTDTSVAEGTEEIVTEPLWAFFLAGAIAICAMILPGISGSFILVMLGMYPEVLGAVNDRDVVTLTVFALGCITGLALFSTLLNWLLEHYHAWVISAMIGLMIGSTRVLWPWPSGTQTTTLAAPSDPVLVPLLLATAGFVTVIGVEWVSTRVGRRTESAPPVSATS